MFQMGKMYLLRSPATVDLIDGDHTPSRSKCETKGGCAHFSRILKQTQQENLGEQLQRSNPPKVHREFTFGYQALHCAKKFHFTMK